MSVEWFTQTTGGTLQLWLENPCDCPKLIHSVGKSNSGRLASCTIILFLNFCFFIPSVILFAVYFSKYYTHLVKCLCLRFINIIVCNFSTTFHTIILSCIHFLVYFSSFYVLKPVRIHSKRIVSDNFST